MEMPSKCYFNNIIRRIASGIWPHAPPQYQSPAQLFVDKVIKDPDEMLMLRLLPALESVPEPSARELAAAATCYLCSTPHIELAILRIAVILHKKHSLM